MDLWSATDVVPLQFFRDLYMDCCLNEEKKTVQEPEEFCEHFESQYPHLEKERREGDFC